MSALARAALVVSLALGVRLLAHSLLALGGGGGDAVGYDQLARSLHDAHVFAFDGLTPTAIRAPGFPAFAAAVWSVTGVRRGAVELVQMCVQIIALAVLAVSCARAFGVSRDALMVVLLLNPCDVFYPSLFLSETITEACLALAMAALLIGHARGPVLAGVVFAAAALTRDVFLLLPLGLLAAACVRPWGPRAASAAGADRSEPGRDTSSRSERAGPGAASARDLVIVTLVAFLCVLPWSVRNRVVAHVSAPVTSGLAGYNLWCGTWEQNTEWLAGGMQNHPSYAFRSEQERVEVLRRRAAPSADDDAYFMALAIDRLRNEPLSVLATWIRRMPLMWFGTRSEILSFAPTWLARHAPAWLVLKSALWVTNFALLAFGLTFGLRFAWQRRAEALLAWPLVYCALVYLPFRNAETRFSQPLLPYVACLALLGLRHHRALPWLRDSRASDARSRADRRLGDAGDGRSQGADAPDEPPL